MESSDSLNGVNMLKMQKNPSNIRKIPVLTTFNATCELVDMRITVRRSSRKRESLANKPNDARNKEMGV